MSITIAEFLVLSEQENLYNKRYFEDFCRKHDIRTREGETRFCAIFPEEGYVIKIPRMMSNVMDYCQKEIENYELAKSYCVERVLLPIEFVHENAVGCKLYKQPICTTSVSSLSCKEVDRLIRKTKNLDKSLIVEKINCGIFWSKLDKLWLSRVLQLYGKNFCKSFEKWTHKAKVNDLHDSNVGFLNGKPVILDYAGYHF